MNRRARLRCRHLDGAFAPAGTPKSIVAKIEAQHQAGAGGSRGQVEARGAEHGDQGRREREMRAVLAGDSGSGAGWSRTAISRSRNEARNGDRAGIERSRALAQLREHRWRSSIRRRHAPGSSARSRRDRGMTCRLRAQEFSSGRTSPSSAGGRRNGCGTPRGASPSARGRADIRMCPRRRRSSCGRPPRRTRLSTKSLQGKATMSPPRACLRGRLMSSASPYQRTPSWQSRATVSVQRRRRGPALRTDAGGLFERVKRLADREALLVRRHVVVQAVLRVAVPAMSWPALAARRSPRDRVRRSARCKDRGGGRVAIERAQAGQQPFATAVLRPLDGAGVLVAVGSRASCAGRGPSRPTRSRTDADQYRDGFSTGPNGGVLRCALIFHLGRFPVAGQLRHGPHG